MIVAYGLGKLFECFVFAKWDIAKLHNKRAFRYQDTVLERIGYVIFGEIVFEIDLAGEFG